MKRKKGRKKNFHSAVTVQFTSEEKMNLDSIAHKDKRTLAGEINWLIESYAKGNLREHRE